MNEPKRTLLPTRGTEQHCGLARLQNQLGWISAKSTSRPSASANGLEVVATSGFQGGECASEQGADAPGSERTR